MTIGEQERDQLPDGVRFTLDSDRQHCNVRGHRGGTYMQFETWAASPEMQRLEALSNLLALMEPEERQRSLAYVESVYGINRSVPLVQGETFHHFHHED